ncbi:MAG TPA: glycosyltransferase family 2 protein [Thermoanaerobaculia bacterium]|nr:glycosyltransferase family 2 protein [Thermoanaerobaculia bacterium]
MPTVSVVVPAHQASRVLPPCLDALARSELRPSEVIVVDDGPSTDGTGEVARARGARVVETPRRLGPGGARNAGVAAAAGEVVVFVDADVCARPDALGLLVEELDRDSSTVAAFGSYDTSPPGTNFTSQYKNLMHHYVHQRGREEAFTFWAGLGAVRRAAFLAAGGFDAERYPRPSIEDIELGGRLLRAGGRIRVVKAAQGTHLKNWTLTGLLRTDVFDRGVPWTELLLSSGGLPDDLNLGLRHRVGVAATGLALASLPFSVARRKFPWAALFFAAVAAGAGSDAIAFLARQRGWAFAVRAIPLHLAYFAESGAAFLIGAGKHFVRGAPRR